MVENLINDLLDLAKLENHSFSLNVGFFNLADTIHRAFEMLLFSANEAGIELRAQIDSLKHLNFIQRIHGDERRYLQILLNFLSNSLKFTNKNGVVKIGIKVLNYQLI